jgi:hypothetical protein
MGLKEPPIRRAEVQMLWVARIGHDPPRIATVRAKGKPGGSMASARAKQQDHTEKA